MEAAFLRPLANPLAYRTANVDLFNAEQCDRFLGDVEPSLWDPVEMLNDGRIVRDVAVQGPDYQARSDELSMLLAAITQVNDELFRFDTSGIWDYDPPVVIRYVPGQGHYDWHTDCAESSPRRKISFTVLLSDPSDFDGGDLEIQGFGTCPRVRGTLNVFPAFMWHRVTPVTRGERVVLVGWIQGPTFR